MSSSIPPNISQPLRILYLAPPDTEKIQLLEGNTIHIETPYYSATIPIWHDEISITADKIQKWEAEWRANEAGDVVRSIGAWVVALRKPSNKDDLEAVRTLLTTLESVIKHHTSGAVESYSMSNEPLLLCLGLHQSTTPRLEMSDDEWEDLCRECGGWEWIDGEAGRKERNNFGEMVGMARLKEALEAHEWDNDEEGAALSDEFDFEGADDELSRPADDMAGQDSRMKEPILTEKDLQQRDDGKAHGFNMDEGEVDSGEDDQVQELESMMLKMQAIKDMGADMPETERRRFAAKAVRDVMRKM